MRQKKNKWLWAYLKCIIDNYRVSIPAQAVLAEDEFVVKGSRSWNCPLVCAGRAAQNFVECVWNSKSSMSPSSREGAVKVIYPWPWRMQFDISTRELGKLQLE